MTQQFENFVNAALDKSLASDVTLPTADKIPVFTGIGRQVTGKTKAELGLATSSQLTGKADLVDGVVPANQLPSYVDDVLEYPNLASFPTTGESGKVYVALDTNKTYRWSGSTYVLIGSDLALGETASTAYQGDRGKTAYDHSQVTGNPHGATTDNINDSTDKRYVTDAQRTRVNTAANTSTDGYLTSTDWTTFNGKQAALVSSTNIKTVNGNSLLGSGDLSLFTPRVSTVTNIAYTLQAADNDGNTYLRVTTVSSATITIPSTQTTPITIRRATYQSVTLQGDLGVTLNGSLTFDVVGSTKSIIPIGVNQFDVVG